MNKGVTLSAALSGGDAAPAATEAQTDTTPGASGHLSPLCWLPHVSKHQKRKQFLNRYFHNETTQSSASAYCVMLQSSFVCFTTQFGYRTSVHCKHKQHGKG